MKVKVKLFGTLGQNISGYRRSQEIEVEMPDRALVKDFLAHLDISESQGVVVVAEGRILGMDDGLQDGVLVNVFQAIRGGLNIQHDICRRVSDKYGEMIDLIRYDISTGSLFRKRRKR